MTAEPPVSPATPGEPAPRRRRDATETRQLLLDAARQRFARDGYAATTVRDIADDAGVNVALISRYFSSKEGLFEACLRAAGDELHRTAGQTPAERVPEAIARHIADLGTAGLSSQLTLLLRSSGDAGADEIRLGVLSRASQQLAAARGWRPGEPGSEEILLRAQMALAAGIGVAVLRSSSIRLEPLSAATEQDLVGPLRELVDALLPPR
ncbi:TetR/AcrR family transcriptional regulator [Micromonospora sp. WMMC250]|uniref:TetR/AcrR family transcriptional regulator n=1 Tax=Micromonospora sp. WMMC250 TaxID=3014781 RepID=UPI0022B6FD79|nr:TetR/AcrR family transcriptional regulator [Micromonospora sp. WMMC250]MCZ7373824.1 TetR family transcriptional regulator [Micromonospora sp. WMMC250]